MLQSAGYDIINKVKNHQKAVYISVGYFLEYRKMIYLINLKGLLSMDAMVLQAQKWVNLTYGNNPGFQRTPENGRTGWNTMFSLIMGLQIELGILELVPNFGSTTLMELTKKFPEIGIEKKSQTI